MTRPALEVADIFRGHGAAWRDANRGHVSLDQLKVMSAIESCRTAALGGHVARCEDCAHTAIAYNSCRNRHCPKCQGAAAREWMAARESELLPVPYFHVVFTLPSEIGDIAYQNKGRNCGFARSRPPFRNEVARHSEIIPPTVPR
jgi:Transposase zinc-binding domain